jgi:N-acetylglucosaminyldiphosphoundecaprenol N-acetyl-beta-D-mannosaminyltransferase
MIDLNRDTWCLLGLPFDAIDMQQTVEFVHRSVAEKYPCFISTPNLNFLITSQVDPAFRNSVLNSELSIADGMPLIWVARMLGVPLPERVTGSGLIEALRSVDIDRKIVRVFFFGGEAGVAELACEVINNEKGGISCVGFYYPGFGPVSEMGDSTLIETINESNADFIIVSLGAKKGQAWIELNREKLTAPVISHLGAVVNFVAGSIKRGPTWMQKSGLEWAWRIVQEPKLWRRYFTDGIRFLSLIIRRVLPYAFWRFKNASLFGANQPVSCDVDLVEDVIEITLHGRCINQSLEPLRQTFRVELEQSVSIRLNLEGVLVIDGAFLGLCLMFRKHLNKNGYSLQFVGLNRDVRRIFHWNCVDYLL